jgi:hypothetical protein
MITCYLALKGGIHALAFYSPRNQEWINTYASWSIRTDDIVAWWYLPRKATNTEVQK